MDECRAEYNESYKGGNFALPRGIINEMFCARNRKNNTDTCGGDSGSAIQMRLDEKFYVVGVTSFGFGCATELPSFYTRVSSYLDWIEEIV